MAEGNEPRPVVNNVLYWPKYNYVLALFAGTATMSVPYQGIFTNVTPNTSSFNGIIYGTNGIVGATCTVQACIFDNKSLKITFIPSVTLSDYTELGKGFMLELSSEVYVNMS